MWYTHSKSNIKVIGGYDPQNETRARDKPRS